MDREPGNVSLFLNLENLKTQFLFISMIDLILFLNEVIINSLLTLTLTLTPTQKTIILF